MSTHSDGIFSGALSDGRSASAKRVEVSLGQTAEVRTTQGLPASLAGHSQLRSSVPLRAKAADVLLTLQPEATHTLFVAEPSFSRQLLRRAPALSAASQRWRGLRPGMTAVAAVLAVTMGMWFFELHPAQAVARLMPQKSREALGRNFVAALTSEHKACETPASRAALHRLTLRLTAAASSSPMPARVMLLDWGLVNAFAVPGGQIILTRGLVRAAGSADEVAGVLAHELGTRSSCIRLRPRQGHGSGRRHPARVRGLGRYSQQRRTDPDAISLYAHRRARSRRTPAHAQGRRLHRASVTSSAPRASDLPPTR
jgi:hypothetical protein